MILKDQLVWEQVLILNNIISILSFIEKVEKNRSEKFKYLPDKLRESVSLSEVVGKKVILKNKGKEFFGLCPFHNEKTPSFTVNDEKGFYHCFGCGAHGDIIGFVMQNEGLGFKDSVIKLAHNFNL